MKKSVRCLWAVLAFVLAAVPGTGDWKVAAQNPDTISDSSGQKEREQFWKLPLGNTGLLHDESSGFYSLQLEFYSSAPHEARRISAPASVKLKAEEGSKIRFAEVESAEEYRIYEVSTVEPVSEWQSVTLKLIPLSESAQESVILTLGSDLLAVDPQAGEYTFIPEKAPALNQEDSAAEDRSASDHENDLCSLKTQPESEPFRIVFTDTNGIRTVCSSDPGLVPESTPLDYAAQSSAGSTSTSWNASTVMIDENLLKLTLSYESDTGRKSLSFQSDHGTELYVTDSVVRIGNTAAGNYSRASDGSLVCTFTDAGLSSLASGSVVNFEFQVYLPAGTSTFSISITDNGSFTFTRSSGSSDPFGWFSSLESQVRPLSGSADSKIAQLKKLLPQGKYWNHTAGQGSRYNPESWTDHPCTQHSSQISGAYQCNFFDGGCRCNGFAYLCYYKFNGVRFNSAGTQMISSGSGVRAGDVIHTHTATDGPNGHASFVWKVSGDTVYKLEGNYAGNCKIWHSATVKKSDIIRRFTPASRTVRYESGQGTGNMKNKNFLYGTSAIADPVGFRKDGYVFAGWNVWNPETQCWLYTNSKGKILEFRNDETARLNNCPARYIIQNCGNIDHILPQTRNFVLTASWMKQDPDKLTMFRLYNPHSGEHFYTGTSNEYLFLTQSGWKYEGVGWVAPNASEQPVYRLYNKNGGDHHYTVSTNERDYLIQAGWKFEGIGWYSAESSGIPLYRQYNPNAKTGSHNYTTSRRENDFLTANGWKAEGIGWYGLTLSESGQ